VETIKLFLTILATTTLVWLVGYWATFWITWNDRDFHLTFAADEFMTEDERREYAHRYSMMWFWVWPRYWFYLLFAK